MKWFDNLKLNRKLLAGFILVALIAGFIGFIGITNIRKVDQGGVAIYQRDTVPLVYAGKAAVVFQQMRVYLRDLLLDQKGQAQYFERIENLDRQMRQLLARYANTLSTATEKNEYDELRQALDKYQEFRLTYFSFVKAKDERAYPYLIGQVVPAAGKVQTTIDRFFGTMVARADQNAISNTKETRQTIIIMIGVSGIGMLLAIGLGLFLSSSITRPIKRLTAAAKQLALGDVNVNVKSDTQDEIGELTASFHMMIANIREHAEIAEKIAAGDLNIAVKRNSDRDVLAISMKRVVDTLRALLSETTSLTQATDAGKLDARGEAGKFQGGYKEIVTGINKTLDTIILPLNEAQQIMARIALNDYTLEMCGEYEGVFKEFAAAINAVRARLLSVQDAFVRVGKGDTSRLEEFRQIGKRCENDRLMPACMAMMQAIRNLIEETGRLAEAAVNGNLGVRGDDLKFEGGFREIIQGINKTLDAVAQPLGEASAVLQEMAQGNLSLSMDGEYQGEFAKMKGAFNGTIHSFNELLGDIHFAAAEVASASKEVATSSQTLSQGSTEQASAIEELSAAIEQIAVQTKQNAQNANQANELALDAKAGAEQGNARMKAMLGAMTNINEASGNISRIIKVIDEIAFQTNILSLNAAVEAARAGQHGKGFAVVAEEVRNLAARSAEAARETTALIEGSIKKAEEGSKIADETAAALHEIVADISKVATLVNDIMIASNEQASGIAQINQGIIQVSEVTQSNTASSEESAAASEELSGQADLLKGMVRKFRLKKGVAERQQPSQALWKSKAVDAGQPVMNWKTQIRLHDSEFGKY